MWLCLFLCVHLSARLPACVKYFEYVRVLNLSTHRSYVQQDACYIPYPVEWNLPLQIVCCSSCNKHYAAGARRFLSLDLRTDSLIGAQVTMPALVGRRRGGRVGSSRGLVSGELNWPSGLRAHRRHPTGGEARPCEMKTRRRTALSLLSISYLVQSSCLSSSDFCCAQPARGQLNLKQLGLRSLTWQIQTDWIFPV